MPQERKKNPKKYYNKRLTWLSLNLLPEKKTKNSKAVAKKEK